MPMSDLDSIKNITCSGSECAGRKAQMGEDRWKEGKGLFSGSGWDTLRFPSPTPPPQFFSLLWDPFLCILLLSASLNLPP